ncbi:MAG: NupC/NupG family nucleoside CNT transporter [Holophagales bacterium]|nr:NupC/NupG family nucleoside CNT transporter [Holophagales bacterium]MYG30732.1 NupC/NupG family nucleoside CNT transporter [Holophagales bacterium]MYI81672.1 NupC/NupG family nucleoside CNT transporter [Holophagales bacterium]
MTGLIGLLVIPGIAWLLSTNRFQVRWRTVVTGIAIQFVLALLILRTAPGEVFFEWATRAVTAFLAFADDGSRFVFGQGFDLVPFAFRVLPTIIFFSSVVAVLYHLGVIQRVVKLFAVVMTTVMGTSGPESLSASANIFVGQTEAPLLIRHYVGSMTRSELMAVMTGGFATVAGGVMAAYVGMGIPAGHLIAASVMSAPAALVMAKLMIPETETDKVSAKADFKVKTPWANMIDAAAQGAGDGLKLALNVGAMLLAFIALVALVNGLLGPVGGWIGLPGLNLEMILGFLFRPLAWVMGVPWAEADAVGTLLGLKTAANEFVAYSRFEDISAENQLSEKSQVIATYALCGFSNFSSIAIQIGGIGGIAPERKSELASLGLRAMIAGTLACLQTATIAGLLI